MRSTTIELNGKRYDARTGKVLSVHAKAPAPVSHAAKPAVKHAGMVLDGFTKRKVTAVRSSTTAHAVHKKTERSKTLMRTVVKKPAVAKAKPAAPAVARHKNTPHLDIDPKRASRAQTIKKSNLVSRFGTPQRAITPITSALPVQPEPTAPPLPTLDEHHKPTIAQRSSAHQKSFQKAIDNSNSHKQPKAKKTTRRQHLSRKLRVSNRTINLAAASMSVLLIVGFIAYQNVPNLSMRVAAARAGIEGSLPGYQPSGFGLSGPIAYQQGQITFNYKSHSDDRKFEVSQKASQWNSETLLESFVAVGDKTFQTFQDSGKTIYIYDDNNATWVDGGVWYEIKGNTALSSDQLLRMASSM